MSENMREAERRVIKAARPLAHFVRHSLNAGPTTNRPGREGQLWGDLHRALDDLALRELSEDQPNE